MAVDLAWPDGAELVLRAAPEPGTLRVATGVYANDILPTLRAEGALSEQVWQIEGEQGDPTTLVTLVQTQLEDHGYEITFSCVDSECGGFDFRYGLPIAEGPAMHVDLGNFLYITAASETADGMSHVAITLSHGGRKGYAHVAAVTPENAAAPTVVSSSRLPAADLDTDDPITSLLSDGRLVLDDLTFQTGASTLSGTEYESLSSLGAFLQENPTRRVVLVGHTDAEGSLEANIGLSRARANAVRQFLIDELGVGADQMQAEGIGFLAPRSSNATPEGRDANRRVEVVLADPN